MATLSVRNGTPIGTVSLCSTCSHAHIIEGYRESETVVLCTYASYDHALRIQFRVKSCTNHEDRSRPTWAQMQKLAMPVNAGTLKPVGFLGRRKADAIEEEEDD